MTSRSPRMWSWKEEMANGHRDLKARTHSSTQGSSNSWFSLLKITVVEIRLLTCPIVYIVFQVVRRATGKCTETMSRESWDVHEYVGQLARLRLVDASSGGWGHINFDDMKGDIDCSNCWDNGLVNWNLIKQKIGKASLKHNLTSVHTKMVTWYGYPLLLTHEWKQFIISKGFALEQTSVIEKLSQILGSRTPLSSTKYFF